MKITLTITQKCLGEGGHIQVDRTDGAAPVTMGTIKFEDDSQKKWLLAVLMEYHPYVSISDAMAPCDPKIEKVSEPC